MKRWDETWITCKKDKRVRYGEIGRKKGLDEVQWKWNIQTTSMIYSKEYFQEAGR